MPARPRRPFGVTLIALLVLTIASLNLLRLALSILRWQFLSTLEGVSPLYQTLSGLAWASTGFVLIWGLWRKKRWAPRAVGWGALLYAVVYWLERFFLTGWLKSGQPPANLAFAAGSTLITLAFIIWTLSRPKIKAIYGVPYGEPHERSS